jgi:hypothetical protein
VKLLPRSFVCAFALLSIPSLAPADEPTVAERAQARVETGLVKPLAERENTRFSRARPAPRERRVRITSSIVITDKSGRPFLPFAIDVRFGSEWRENDMVGCVYTPNHGIFVKRGEAYRPAAFLLGENLEPVAGVCEAAPPPRS